MLESRRAKLQMGAVVTICLVALVIFFTVRSGSKSPSNSDNSNVLRFDCVPDAYGKVNDDTKAKCADRGCNYEPQDSTETPACYYPSDYPSYEVQFKNDTPDGFYLSLVRSGRTPVWPPQTSDQLGVSVHFLTETVLRVKIEDQSGKVKPFEALELLESTFVQPRSSKPNVTDYKLEITEKPFGFKVTRLSTGLVIFDTTQSKIVFGERFKEISAVVPSPGHLYGLAEHKAPMYLNEGKRKIYTFFNRGEQPEEKNDPQFNLYGYHPQYLILEEDGNANGVYFHNAHALDIVLQPSLPSLTYRVVGGNLDFFFFLGPKPDDVVSQYTAVVGRPFLPPYWALGFHLCRYNYLSANATLDAWKKTSEAGIPLDGQWNDIDYMDDHKDFTYDSVGFSNLPEVIDELHSNGSKYIINISPGLTAMEKEGTYKPYEIAYREKLFITDPKTEEPLHGTCWQNETVWLDFTNSKTVDFWVDQLVTFHDKVKFDALWLDMNEPYSFRSLEAMGCNSSDPLMNLPYTPGQQPLSNSTLCMYAKDSIGTHFETHTLYSYYESKATFKALEKILNGQRPWIISRASRAGQGRYTSHWSGDITAHWETMRHTISNMVTFNMMGMPLIGADICGFRVNTTKELCRRWHQLGAFYTFSRNHNDFDTIDHDPVSMGPEVTAAAKESIQLRYLLLPYLYTLFYKAHLYGTTVARPLFFEYPKDEKARKVDLQFMWGDAIMFNPALFEETDEVETYFPAGRWYSNFNEEIVGPTTKSIKTDPAKPNINFKAGHIIPTQDPALRTQESRKNPFGLIVYMNENGSAAGDLYWDDGSSLNATFNYIKFNVCKLDNIVGYLLTTEPQQTDSLAEQMNLGKVKVLNSSQMPIQVIVNDKNWPFYSLKNQTLIIDLTTDMPALLQSVRIEWRY